MTEEIVPVKKKKKRKKRARSAASIAKAKAIAKAKHKIRHKAYRERLKAKKIAAGLIVPVVKPKKKRKTPEHIAKARANKKRGVKGLDRIGFRRNTTKLLNGNPKPDAYTQMLIGCDNSKNSKGIRQYLIATGQLRCEVCGYDEHSFCIELHHLDNNPRNNSISNIVVLCCMCHRKHRYKIIDALELRKLPIYQTQIVKRKSKTKRKSRAKVKHED